MIEDEMIDKISEHRRTARSELAGNGLSMHKRPASYNIPRLPTNLTDLPDERIMQLLAQFVRYQDFVQTKLYDAEVEEAAAETQLDTAKAKHLVKTWTGAASDRVAIGKAHAALDEEVIKWSDVWQQAKAKRKMYSVLFESLGRDASVVSREISRRIGRNDHDRRVDRYSA